MIIRQPIVFYLDKNDVQHLDVNCKNECNYELHSPNTTLLPFIIKRISSPNPVSVFKVQCEDGSNIVVLDPALVTIACTIIEDGVKFDLLVYDGSVLGETIDCGFKQIVVADGVDTYFSELIFVGDFDEDNAPFWKLAWSHTCGLLNVPYNDPALANFEFFVFLNKDVEWGLPEYEHERTEDSDGLGNITIEAQRVSKIFELLTGFIPEFLVDAISFAILHDSLELQEKNGTERTKLLETEFSNEGDTNGCFHETTLNFKTEDDQAVGSCCEEIEKVPCITIATVQNVVSAAIATQQSAIELLPPNVDDCYFIIVFGVGCPGDDWCDHQGEVACWNGSGWDYTVLAEFDVIYNVALAAFFMKLLGVLVEIPIITFTSTVGIPITSVDVEADIHNCYFGRLEFSYDGGGTYPEVAGHFTFQELQDGVTVAPKLLNPTQIRIVMFNYNCPEIIGNAVNI